MKHVLSILLCLCLFTGNVQAEAPRPEKKKSLKEMQVELMASKKNERALDEKMAGIQTDIESTREKMVSLSRSIQENEARLQKLERDLTDNQKMQDKLQDTLEEYRKSMARLIMALQRIRRLPPEALFAKPGAPLETAQSAMLLSEIIPVLNNKAEALKTNLDQLKQVTQKIRTDREESLAASKKLHEEQKELEALVEKREKLYAQTQKDLKATQSRIEQISMKSRNLRDLIKRLDDERRNQIAQAAKAAAAQKTAQSAAPSSYQPVSVLTPMPPSGDAQLPVSGIIKTSYQQPDAFGAPSEGLTISGRKGGLVVAPMSGIVRYTGVFKNYGQLVIIEHDGGYHSLIAGLEKIDTVVDRKVAVGEPIGMLKSSSAGNPSLYYELRQHGRPVNPAKKFAELG